MRFSTKALTVWFLLVIAGGVFATPAHGITIFSETYSAGAGTATDNTYTVFSGSPAAVAGGQQDFSGGQSTIIQSPVGSATDFSLSSPLTISFDLEFTGPLAIDGDSSVGLVDASTENSISLFVNLTIAFPFVAIAVVNNGDSGIDFISAAGLVDGTTYTVSATLTPGGTPGTTDVLYSMVAISGPGGDITTGTAGTLTEVIPSVLATDGSGFISGEGNFLTDNILISGTTPPPPAPTSTSWGLALMALALMSGGLFATRHMHGRRNI